MMNGKSINKVNLCKELGLITSQELWHFGGDANVTELEAKREGPVLAMRG